MNTSPVDFVTLYNLANKGQASTVQHALMLAGDYTGIIDGAFGPKSEAARQAYSRRNGLPSRVCYIGANGCNWTVYSDGPDLVARAILGTCFGSMADVASGQDNGITASGFRLKDHPTALVVSLPLSRVRACLGSPWGRNIPFGTHIDVSLPGASRIVSGTLQEIGPSSYTGNGVDLSEQMCKNLSGNPQHFNPNAWKMFADVRVLNGVALASR